MSLTGMARIGSFGSFLPLLVLGYLMVLEGQLKAELEGKVSVAVLIGFQQACMALGYYGMG